MAFFVKAALLSIIIRVFAPSPKRVIGILGAGGIATAFSVWRLVMMVEKGSSTDYTILFVRVVLTG